MMSNKKKILIIHPSMAIGGAERALLGLLDSIDYEHYEVDLLLCSHTGEFMPLVNEKVSLLPYDRRFDFSQCPVSQLVKNGQWLKAAVRVWARQTERRRAHKFGLEHSVWHAQQVIHRAMSPLVPKVKGCYDVAINFLGVPSILVNKISAKVKMTWVHTDYSKIVADPKLDREMYDDIDWIVNVSDDCKRVFDRFYPEYESKSIVVENILNTSFVEKLASAAEDIPFEHRCINILSIGRFGHAKNFESIPEICRLMTDLGVPSFKWYILGYGGCESLIRDNIRRFNVDGIVEILGKRVNPYPYIKACDIYVQPSRFEGKAVTVREAQILGKPVIVTAYDTAPSQIRNGVDGLILPMDTANFAHDFARILVDSACLSKIAKYCATHEFGNETEVEKIYNLIKE